MLKFSSGVNNYKLRCLSKHLNIPYSHIVSFDLPAGFSCPKANICKTYANYKTGKITDSKHSTVRCYASSMESRYLNVRKSRWFNFNTLLKLNTVDNIYNEIINSIPKHTKIIRIHASGDFYSENYFLAWCKVAENKPDIQFYGYTKILSYATAIKPDNFKLIYSHGSLDDNQADSLNIPQVYIVNTVENPPATIICDNKENAYQDYIYIQNQESFSILIHGTQKARSK